MQRTAVSVPSNNAIKFTKSGKIQLSIRISDLKEGEIPSIVFSVSDTGIGIKPEHLPGVFDKFYRVDTSDKAISGTGLGMSIVKNYVEAHAV